MNDPDPDILWSQIRESERTAPADRPTVLVIEEDPDDAAAAEERREPPPPGGSTRRPTADGPAALRPIAFDDDTET